MEQLIIVVAVLPLLSALLIQLFAGRIGRGIARLSVAATTLSFLFAVLLLWWALTGHGPKPLPRHVLLPRFDVVEPVGVVALGDVTIKESPPDLPRSVRPTGRPP